MCINRARVGIYLRVLYVVICAVLLFVCFLLLSLFAIGLRFVCIIFWLLFTFCMEVCPKNNFVFCIIFIRFFLFKIYFLKLLKWTFRLQKYTLTKWNCDCETTKCICLHQKMDVIMSKCSSYFVRALLSSHIINHK